MPLIEGQKFVARDYFAPVSDAPISEFAKQAELIERSASIENHEFFTFAKLRPSSLVLWAGQEAVVTNPFSQILLSVISAIPNVHVRSILMPVVSGEHSRVSGGIAKRSHPWLIWRLCQSLGIGEDDITVTAAVSNFINVLHQSARTPMKALGVLGIGNELMLLAEYRAVEACFDECFPDAEYRDFLHANIGEDEVHTQLISEAATAMAGIGYPPAEFLLGAQEGVAARVRYYDALLSEANQTC